MFLSFKIVFNLLAKVASFFVGRFVESPNFNGKNLAKYCSFYVAALKPKNICCFLAFSIKPSRKSILTIFSVILVDVIRTTLFLSISAFRIEVIISATVSLPMITKIVSYSKFDYIHSASSDNQTSGLVKSEFKPDAGLSLAISFADQQGSCRLLMLPLYPSQARLPGLLLIKLEIGSYVDQVNGFKKSTNYSCEIGSRNCVSKKGLWSGLRLEI